MKTLPKILLAATVITFAASLTGPGLEIWFGTLKPVSALLFIAAFIVHIVSGLDPEQYEADQQLRKELMQHSRSDEAIRIVLQPKIAA